MQFRDDQERLVAEQAVLQYRATLQAADEATFGHGMEAIEEAALAGSREHGRRLVELAMQRAAQKASTSVPAAAAGRTSNGSARGR